MEKSRVVIEKVLMTVLLLATAILMIRHLYSPFSMLLSMRSETAFAVSGPDPAAVFYYPSRRLAVIAGDPGINECGGGEDCFREKVSRGYLLCDAPVFWLDLNPDEIRLVSRLKKKKTAKDELNLLLLAYRVKRDGRTGLSWIETFLLARELAGFSRRNAVFLSSGGRGGNPSGYYSMVRNFALGGEGNKGNFIPRTEIFNASGKKGAAYAAAKYLRSVNVDVLNYGNYPSIQERTKFVNYTEDLDNAFAVREKLKMEDSPVYFEYKPSAIAESAVILGRDFNPETVPKTNY